MLSGSSLWVGLTFFFIFLYSNETGKLYPYTKKSFNQAAIKMYTEEEIKIKNFIVSKFVIYAIKQVKVECT